MLKKKRKKKKILSFEKDMIPTHEFPKENLFRQGKVSIQYCNILSTKS